ncbi:AMP-binding protein [Sphingomonas gei]|uniref:AMP-binding protein n=1 Tax=Sphingomonas gei TaxID=1395960 RepID=UPI0014426743|nr:AMP-binding protein [Sphingomonas gei]
MTPRVLEVVAIEARASIDFVGAVFQCTRDGEAFVIAASAEIATRYPGLKIRRFVRTGERQGWFSESLPARGGASIAQVSFTSGTTGTPKGIALSHDAVADTIGRLNAFMGVTPEIREYLGVPPTFSFGLGRVRAAAAAGGAIYLPEKGFDPREFGAMLAAGEVNALSLVPTLARVLLEHCDQIGVAGASLRWMELGSQYLSCAEKEALRSLFPNARIVQHYGLTEASRTTLLDIAGTRGAALDSVGQPVGATEIGIAEDGRIRIRGPHVASHWIDNDGWHALVDADGWLVTNDLGAIEDGFLYFQGRADDLINCGGIKLVPELLEEKLRARLSLAGGLAATRVPDTQRGDGILIAVEDTVAPPDAEILAIARAALAEHGLSPGNALHLLRLAALPVTATGKVQRRELARIAEESGVLTPIAIDLPLDEDGAHSLRSAVARLLGIAEVPESASFIELGGDSLNYVHVSMLIDERLGYLPERWEHMPLAALDQLSPVKGTGAVVDSSVLVRAIAILLVVLDHAWINAAGGAAVALMLVAGQNFARFQVPKVLQGRGRALLAATFWRVLLPYFAFVTLTLVGHHRMFWPQYLLVSNFTEGVTNAAGNRLLVPYWFMEDYLLYVLLFTGLLSLGWARTAMRASAWRFALVLVATLLPLGMVGPFLRGFWPFYSQTLISVGWIFALGWLIFEADTAARKRVAWVLAAVGLVWSFGFEQVAGVSGDGLPAFYDAVRRLSGDAPSLRQWIFIATQIGAVWLLINVRRISAPPLVARGAAIVASASLYIYMCHPFVLHFISQHGTLVTAIPAVAASAAVGIALWRAIALVEKLLVRLRGRTQPPR